MALEGTFTVEEQKQSKTIPNSYQTYPAMFNVNGNNDRHGKVY